jgi:hypothetical protein
MTSTRLAFASAAVITSTVAQAGWISGGGKIRRDGSNPWFVYNTTRVTWCVDLDPSAVTVTLDEARQDVASAFAYWQAELSRSVGSDPRGREPYPELHLPPGALQLATQEFVPVDCDGREDVRFYVGKATDDLVAYLALSGETPSDYVGLTVRTEYDIPTLHGRGFVYIAPDVAGSRWFPRHPRALPGSWSKYGRASLVAVLQHELGHVFGVPHELFLYDDFGYYSLMAEEFPEVTITRDAEGVARRPWPRLFHWSDAVSTYASCRYNFLGVLLDPDHEYDCVEVPSGSFDEIRGRRSDGRWVSLATLRTVRNDVHHRQSIIPFWVPDGQSVFPGAFSTIRMNSFRLDGSLDFEVIPTLRPATTYRARAQLNSECFVLRVETDTQPIWVEMGITPHDGQMRGNCGAG